MMRYTMAIALTVVVLAAMTTACWAQGFMYGPWEATAPELEPTPSWFGFTGLVRTPTALITAPQNLAAFGHQINFDSSDRRVYGLNMGLTSTLEIGAARVEDVFSPDPVPTYANETITNIKYEANIGGLFNNPAAPSMAIGIYDVADQINRVNYVVLSQAVGLSAETVSPLPKMNVHVGYGKAERSGGPLDGVFGGVDFIPFEGSLVQIEHDGEDVNGVLRYYPAAAVSLDIGLLNSELGWGFTINTGF